MATIKPNICENNEVYVPDDNCDCCDILTEKVADIEDTLEEHDQRITDNTNNFVNYYDKQTIDAMIGGGGGGGMKAVVVDQLPAVGDPNTFYYVLSDDNAIVGGATTGTSQVGEQGKYEKWLYSDGQWHNIGADHIDFESYVSTTGAIKEYDEKTMKVPQTGGEKLNMKFLGKGDMEEVDLATIMEDLVTEAMANYCPYQVGDILFTATATNPSSRYPNTEWTQIQGKFIYGQDSTHALNSEGGSADAIIPAHKHPTAAATGYRYLLAHGSVDSGEMSAQTGTGRHYPFMNTRSDRAYWGTQDYTGSVGEEVRGKNMPPYITKYIWQRTR